VLVACAHAIFPIHIAEISRPVNCENRSLVGGPKVRRWEMKQFDCTNYFVDSTSPLFTYSEPPHQIRQSFVSRTDPVDEPIHWYYRLSGIGHFKAIAKDFYKYRISVNRKVLMNESVR
jgi:hypothetical protein